MIFYMKFAIRMLISVPILDRVVVEATLLGAIYESNLCMLFSFNLLRQRHDISVLLFIVRSHAL